MKPALLLVVATACYAHAPSTSTSGPQAIGAREGHVVAVHEVMRAASPAAHGALLGGIVFHDGGAAFVGDGFAAAGAPDRHAFQVVVAFDGGETGVFIYQDSSPFRPGERVTLTQNGLIVL